MTRIARKSDGRRIFTEEFKREQIGRVWRGEITLAELGRKLRIARSLLQRWKRLVPDDPHFAGTTSGSVAPARRLPQAQYVRELQLLVGKQAMELELLRAEVDALRRRRRTPGTTRGRPVDGADREAG